MYFLILFVLFFYEIFSFNPTYISIDGNTKLPIVQQPKNDNNWISDKNNEVTQFSISKKYGSIGILAHNFLAGNTFSNIHLGEYIFINFSNGITEIYEVTQIKLYQALSPNDSYSDFLDLEDNMTIINSTDLFYKIYGKRNRLILQTCITFNHISSWGRMFIIAEKIKMDMR